MLKLGNLQFLNLPLLVCRSWSYYVVYFLFFSLWEFTWLSDIGIWKILELIPVHFYDVSIAGVCRLSGICLRQASFRIRSIIGRSVNNPLSLPSWLKYCLHSSVLSPDFALHTGLHMNTFFIYGVWVSLWRLFVKKQICKAYLILVPTVHNKVKLQYNITIYNGPMAMAFNVIYWLNIKKTDGCSQSYLSSLEMTMTVGTEILIVHYVVGDF